MRTAISIPLVLSMFTLGLSRSVAQAFEPSGPSAHGLVLRLALVTPPEAPDSAQLRGCLAHSPKAACVPMVATVTNQGTQTILEWSMSCSSPAGIEIKLPEGNWEPFPQGELPICTRNVLEVKALAPGESAVMRFRMADLSLDTEFPPDDAFIHLNKGYKLLAGTDPVVIRAVVHVAGCVSTKDVHEKDSLDAFSARSLCLGGAQPDEQFVVIRSNPLQL